MAKRKYFLAKEKIIPMYESGMSCRMIADELGIPWPDIIRRFLVEQGVKLRSYSRAAKSRGELGFNVGSRHKASFTEENVKAMAEMYAAGASCSEIGKKFGESGSTVHRWLIENGVPMRSQPDSVRIFLEKHTRKKPLPKNRNDFYSRLSEDQRIGVAELNRVGWSVQRIGELLGCRNYSAICRILRENKEAVSEPKPLPEIAELLGVSVSKLKKNFAAKSLVRKKRGRRKGSVLAAASVLNEIVESYLGGVSVRQIAEKFSLGCDTVRKYLKRRGVEIRHVYPHGLRATLSDEQKAECVRLYQSGMSARQIAEKLGCRGAVNSLYKILRENGVHTDRRTDFSKEQQNETLRLRAKGLSVREISDALGFKPGKIRLFLQKYGLAGWRREWSGKEKI